MHTTPTWNIFQKIGFRFFFLHVLLYAFPFPLDAFTYLEENVTKFLTDTLWGNLVPFMGDLFFSVELPSESPITGSGDMTYNYVQLFSCVFLAVIGAIIWTFIDRKRKNYTKLLRILVIYMAYYVLFSMLSYGFYKIIPLQFPAPHLGRLIQPYGHSSPMGIAWTFMGASKAYTIFSGVAEVTAGLLLIFRRTRTLGGLVAFGVMLNVFMMNMCYDIPVKTYSFHLLFFGLFIFLQDWKRIFAVFFTKAATTPRSFPKYFTKPEYNGASIVLKLIILGHFFYGIIGQVVEANAAYGPNTPKPPLYGIYEIEHFQKNKDTIPMLVTNDTLWRRIVFQRQNTFNAYRMDHNALWLSMELDTVAKTMRVKNYRDSTDIYNFKYTLKDNILTLSGTRKKDTLFIKATQYDLKKFKLINRGFNWINEYPNNR
ncbi:hypothetical protein KORDIASMS9_01877 [Kordia sp. SMS9]|uniref:hypothetical protein n=1 Tax=Kordia sp. SMS9 TaxID=2282170 RepID=UPI000E0DF341|nr:hypothetical protein [Kordia sp. SMS9]AXG69651.1 hypothetical protein KORDIASMS9_01877 [Kordia sp. SMS9]